MQAGLGAVTVGVRVQFSFCHRASEMANAQPDAQEEQQGSSWMRTIMNAVMVYLAINTVTQLIGPRLGSQTTTTGPDGTVTTNAPHAVEAIPALWSLGTKMACPLPQCELTLGYENLSGGRTLPVL